MEKREIAIIGGGPAGLAASIEAARAGAHVLLIDENASPGGQLFKQIHKFFGSKAHSAGIRGIDIGKKLLKETEEAGVEVWLNSSVIGLYEGNNLSVVRSTAEGKKIVTVQADKILICTGGQENAINFEGWTIPGVMGAGCAQTMVNVNRVLPGKRVLMIGSGNVGLIVSYQLMQAGADVVAIVEAADHIGGYGVHAAKVRRAGVPFYLRHTIVRAVAGENQEVCAAVIGQLDDQWNIIPGTEKTIDVDTVCIAAGLRPLAKIAQMYGVKHDFIPEMGGWMPMHDENMETSVHGVYVAGDTAGVEEANTAMDEGRLAGIAMAEALGYISGEKAEQRKNDIRKSLESLRLGPFGERRLKAKERIIARGVAE
ncbi:NAD(P)/FAD-dependent oxidoreductase [Clostridium sp. KNHs216]|uniref:NAD(P)/FAD-dependent oxidoreductase n=1 Tax=Clostridium sp. KNHs216 TaxID=1550235 RepID=UPI001151D9F2|nr:NAD(P)/FAD-dependent oxidoreductase [Clostridium sp. KNHs216]TQI66983.1 thioredoxin reductase [Clostridium sp. KNHs216]